jgi:RNA polymerase sigma-70 factor (ECF subfamily)
VTEVSADWVLPVDGPPIENGRVRFEDGVIVDVSPGRAARHFEDAVILPGIVNAHSHLEYSRYAGFGDGQPFGPWIFRIVTNLSLDVMKHRTKFRHEELSGDEPAARRDSAALPAVTSEIGRRIDRAIESLPEMQRVVARLFLVEEFEHFEIASMTGLSEGTVRSHLSLARKKLREQLADIYGGSDE